jgi:hypothetical protein
MTTDGLENLSDEWGRQMREGYRAEIEQLDELLQPYLHDDFFFADLGANDGVCNDPIYPFVRKYGWKGLVVEPHPMAFAMLQRNYADVADRIIFEQALIADGSQQEAEFWTFEPSGSGIDWVLSQIGSMDRAHMEEAMAGLEAFLAQCPTAPTAYLDELPPVSVTDGPAVEEAERTFALRGDLVRATSFQDLLALHRIDHVDFLNTDLEGGDFDLIRSIDWDTFRPSVLCLEINPFPPEQRDLVTEALTSAGYRYVMPFTLFSSIFVR